MTLLVNSAGVSAADPILAGLQAQFVFAASSFDVATVVEAWLDQASGFPGTSSVKSSLTPVATVVLAGTTAAYNDSTKQLDIASTTGLTSGDALYISHGTITDGFYIVDSVVDGSHVSLENDPFDGGGSQTNVTFQVGWSFIETIGTAPIVSDAPGDQNYFKARVEDSGTNQTDAEDSFWARDNPGGSAYIALDGANFTGQTFGDALLTLAILAAWTNNGGISHVSLADHSVESTNNFTWTSGGGVAERSLAAAESSGITCGNGAGINYGAFEFRTKSGGVALSVDIDAIVDSAGPVVVFTALGA